MSVLAIALAFAKHGLAVFPLHFPVGEGKLVCSCGRLCCRDAAKHPYSKLAKNGVHSATLDPGVIKHWFGYVVPDANLGVACERLVVLDIDPRHDGDQSLAALEHECALPETWRTLTGGGGEHVFFSCPDGVNIKNYSYAPASTPPLGPGIDVRARGGYVVVPPSRHINGRRYEFSVDHHPSDVPLAPLPEWLAERLVVRHAEPGVGDSAVAPTPSDQWAHLTSQPISEYRDKAALSIIGHLFRHNCDPYLVRGLMHVWNSTWCKPPLGYHELDKLIDRVADYHAARIERELGQ
jgi:Bifunctional DNA primase/polymerase, N-terminal